MPNDNSSAKTAAQLRVEALTAQLQEAQAQVLAESSQVRALTDKEKALVTFAHQVFCPLCADAKKKMHCPVETARLKGEGVVDWSHPTVSAWAVKTLKFRDGIALTGWTLS